MPLPSLVHIQSLISQLRSLQQQWEHYHKLWGKEKLRRYIEKLENEIDQAVNDYLRQESGDYRLLCEENAHLLVNEHIEFAVTKEDWGLTQVDPLELSGHVHANGFFYADVTKTRWSLLNAFYDPLVYEGQVNCLGEAQMSITQRSFIFAYRSTIEKFTGSINANGKISMKVSKKEAGVRNTHYLQRIIGDFFSGDDKRRAKFLSNKEKMIAQVSEFREGMI